MTDSQPTVLTEPTVLITRVFDAPRELVFQAWSDPVQLLEWYAPSECTLAHCDIDFRTGGVAHTCIRTPSGYECWCLSRYLEIVPPEKIVLTMGFSDAEGNARTPQEAGADPDWPHESIVTVTFRELPGHRTELTLRQNVSESLAKRTGAYPSWLQMFDRLASLLVKT